MMKFALAVLVLTGAVVGCISATTVDKELSLAGIDGYTYESRVPVYMTLDALGKEIWVQPPRAVLDRRAVPTYAPTYPVAELVDVDGDKKTDKFVYLPSEPDRMTREFGIAFDLDRDGRADYLMFNMGPLMLEGATSIREIGRAHV